MAFTLKKGNNKSMKMTAASGKKKSTVFGGDGAALDDGQEVPLHALGRRVRALELARGVADLVDLTRESGKLHEVHTNKHHSSTPFYFSGCLREKKEKKKKEEEEKEEEEKEEKEIIKNKE